MHTAGRTSKTLSSFQWKHTDSTVKRVWPEEQQHFLKLGDTEALLTGFHNSAQLSQSVRDQ